MCYFDHTRVKKTHLLERKDAIIAYKAFNIDKSGNLISPIAGNKWPRFRCTWYTPSDANFKKLRTSSNSYKHGIYAMYSRTGAKQAASGHVIAKVAIWGAVTQYESGKVGYYYSRRYAGYKAEFAEILEIVSLGSTWSYFPMHLYKLRKRYAKTKLIISI